MKQSTVAHIQSAPTTLFRAARRLSGALIRGVQAGEQAVHHLRRFAHIVARLAELRELFPVERCGHFGHVQQHVQQGAPLVRGDPAGLIDEVVRRLPAERGRKAHHHRFGDDQPARQVHIGPHGVGIDPQALDEEARLGERARGQHEGFRQRGPFDMPGAGGAFEVRRHGIHDQSGAALHLLGAGEDELAGDGIALLRHGGGAAAAGRERLEDLARLRRRQQHHIGRNLGERTRNKREEGHRLGDGVARRMPGDSGLCEPELLHQRVGDLEPAPVQRGERAGRAGELAREDARAELV